MLKTSFKIATTKVGQVRQTVSKSRAKTLFLLWAFVVGFRVNFTFTFTARPTLAVRFFYGIESAFRHGVVCLGPRRGQIASRDMIVGCIRKFGPSGIVTDMVHGALKIVRTEENLDRVRETS